VTTRFRRDDGSLSVELAILLPAFILLALIAVAFGRDTIAQSSVDLAAHDAARAASLARNATDAQSAASAAAHDTLDGSSTSCSAVTVTVDTSGFAIPVGQPATVSVTITCTVPLADLALPGMPASRVLTSTFSSPLDIYRGRT
jgi:Flp pilus assembly protein TadG